MNAAFRHALDQGRLVGVPRYPFQNPVTGQPGWCYVRLAWNRPRSQMVILVAPLPATAERPAPVKPCLPHVMSEVLAAVLTSEELKAHRFNGVWQEPASSETEGSTLYAQVTWAQEDQPVFDYRSPDVLAAGLEIEAAWLKLDPAELQV